MVSKKEVSLIIPTYNESGNILVLLKKVESVMANFDYEIIVVDDNSPDKTWKLVNDYSKKNKRVRLVRRMGRRGLSSAIIEGFDNAQGSLIGVIDADLQHDEKILPKMIIMLEDKKQDKRFVIGSRYSAGGGIDGWTRFRRLQSGVGKILARIVLNVRISDPMTGYFMLKSSIYKKIRKQLNPRGYKIPLEIYYQAKKAGLISQEKSGEMGFVFKERKKGESKLTSETIIEYLIMLYELRLGNIVPLRFLKFCIVGFSGVIVNMGILFGLTEFLDIYYLFSSIVAVEVSIITNYILNNHWTFSDRKKETSKELLKGLLKFNLVSVAGLAINVSVLWLLTSFMGLYYLLSNLFGIMAAVMWNYLINAAWTWKKK